METKKRGLNLDKFGLFAVRAVDNITDQIIILIFLLIFLIGVYFSADSAYVFLDASIEGIRRRQAEADSVQEIIGELTEDAVAWVTLDDTPIDYPLMHCDDNMKYLNLNPYGEYSIAGSIFMDARNSGDFSDEYMLLYGHHMSHGYMFGALDEFENEEYFDAHRTGRIVIDGKEYKLNVFAFAIMDALDENIFDPTLCSDIHGYIDARVAFSREHSDLPILAFSTCRDPGQTTRTLVFTEIIGLREDLAAKAAAEAESEGR